MSKLDKADPKKHSRIFHVSAVEWFAVTDEGMSHVMKKDDEKVVLPLTFSKFEVTGFLEPIDEDAARGLHIDLGDRKVVVKRGDIALAVDADDARADLEAELLGDASGFDFGDADHRAAWRGANG